MTNKKLYLIDGLSQVYRAYHAIPRLSNSKGLPTNAIYGFTTMLRKLIADEKPDYLGVALESEGPTVRHIEYEAYKAHRKPMPDDLVVQLPYIWKVCEVLQIPILAYRDYEADDVIGTLARKATAAGLTCIIVTIDKDMYQLVNDHVFVLDTRKDYLLIDAKKVEEKLGVRPDQVADLLGLCGDASDNIPGAPGIGDKGARDLIRQFGTVENCLQNYEQVPRKTYRESLRDHADQIRMSRNLATIHTDLPIELDLQSLALSEPNREAARALFLELEFSSMVADFQPAPSFANRNYHPVTSEAELSDLRQAIGQCDRVAVAVLPDAVAIALCMAPDNAYLIELPAAAPAIIQIVRELMKDARIEKIFHDLKAGRHTLARYGIDVVNHAQDIMLAAYLLDPNDARYNLHKLAIEYLGSPLVASKAGKPDRNPRLAEYEKQTVLMAGCEQAEAIYRLADILLPKLREQALERLYQEIELPLVEVLAHMEMAGVKVDVDLLATMSGELEAEIGKLTAQIYQAAGMEFNINSPKQLGEVLFEKHGLRSMKRTQKTKNYSTDSKTLEELAEAHELPKLVLDYRQLTKLKSTYIDALPKLVNPETGRIHTYYNQTGTSTGRLSSSEPNFQNLPVRTEVGRKIRAAIVAEEGNRLLSADYSQIELRIMAHLSEDPVLVDAFTKGEDIHTRTALEVFGMQAKLDPAGCRRRAKTINFGVIYGQSAFGLAQQLKISKGEAQRFIDDYFRRYKGVRRWLEETLASARKTGLVKTLLGRIRQVSNIDDKMGYGAGERMAINAPIQGTAADLIKIAMIRIYRVLREEKLRTKLILQVHDELMFEGPEEELDRVGEIAKQEMEAVYPLKVPLLVDLKTGRNWRDMK
jgi:DNA polymerase-1